MVTGSHLRLILWKAEKAVEKFDQVSISKTGLHFSEFAILEVLLHKNAMSMRAIGAKVLLTNGSMTAAVNRLEKKDLVRRMPDSSDRRRIQVYLTELGLRGCLGIK